MDKLKKNLMEEKEIFGYLEEAKQMVFESIRLIRAKGLLNDLRFIDWEDELNRLSTLDPNKPLF